MPAAIKGLNFKTFFMRKSLTVIVLVAIVQLSANAQKSFSIQGGVTLAKMHAKYSGGSEHTDGKEGLTFGFAMDVPINKSFSFQPAVNFTQEGYKVNQAADGYTDKLTTSYVEVPLDVIFRPKMPQVQFFVGAGPSVSLAVSGKEKEDDNGSVSEMTYKFGNDPDKHDMRGMDFGANFLTGIETKSGFLVVANYNLGLRNLIPGGSSDISIKNSYFGFKLGYRFSKHK